MASNDVSTEALIKAGQATMSTSYNPTELLLTRGEGLRVWDRDGREYLDFLAGIAVNALGHKHPAVVGALQDALERGLLNVSNAFFNETQIQLQQKLVELSFADRVFFSNSGAEANEAAIKLARRYQSVVRESPAFEIITFDRSFHGRTYASLSATAQPKYHKGFEPMVPGFVYAEFNNLESVERLMGPHTAAIMVEVIQGEGGVRPADTAFLKGLRRICDEYGALLIFDEVQTGIGRTGQWFGYQLHDVIPDIITLAKGLGGGVPVGAMLATEQVFGGFTYGSHATTFGGNPLSTAAALAVVEFIQENDVCAHVREMSDYIDTKVSALSEQFPVVSGVRGSGLLKGIVVEVSAQELVQLQQHCFEQQLLLKATGGEVLRLVPPLVVTKAEIDDAFERIARAFAAFESESS